MTTKLNRIADISRNDAKAVFTSIYHLLNKELLLQCHKELDRNKATGIDGITKTEYEEHLEANIEELVVKLKNNRYKPQPSMRTYIPKANGKPRPLGISAYEDKIVQTALKKLIEAIYEPRFLNCMFGFRPNRGCHEALKALNRVIEKEKINWVLDADIKGFFDNIDHDKLMKCIEVHIKDPNVNKLIRKYLKAGIMEKGEYKNTEYGVSQGSNISPTLSNIYMHYVLTLWFYKVVRPKFRGDCELIVYADDFVCCFQYKDEAELFCKMLQERLGKVNLELEAEKSRLIEFGRFAASNSVNGKPSTFDFLGFTHYCSKSKKGRFRVKRKTSQKKFKSKVKDFTEWLKCNRNIKLKILISKINVKLIGHYRYYGITDNTQMIVQFQYLVKSQLYKWLNRRSQRRSYTWDTFHQMMGYYPLTRPKIHVNIYDI